MQRDSELVLSVSAAVEETPAEPIVSIPSPIDSVVEETPAEPIIVPTQVVSGQFPLPPLRVLPEIFFRDGPWRFPHERIGAGQLLCDIILLQDSRRRGSHSLGCSVGLFHRFTFDPDGEYHLGPRDDI